MRSSSSVNNLPAAGRSSKAENIQPETYWRFTRSIVIGLVREFRAIGKGNCNQLRFIAHGSPFAHEQRIFVAVADAEIPTWPQSLADDCVEAICIGDGEWPSQESIDQAETSHGQTDGKSQRGSRGCGGDLIFSQLAQTENGVSSEGVEPRNQLDIATGFSMNDHFMRIPG